MNKAVFNWSGGKDSALALYHILNSSEFEVKQLLTSVNTHTNRISMHGVRLDMLERQAEAVGLPLNLLELPKAPSMAEYDQLMRSKLEGVLESGIEYSVFGDIFLEDLKKYREERLSEVGLKAIFPLWKRNTKELIGEFLSLGFRTIVVAVDGSKLDKSFVGRELTDDFVADLPQGIDPCGENGEFHTFVFDGPIFKQPIDFKRGEVVAKSYSLSQNDYDSVTYWFQDLLPD
ncbi:diphthine--ammonia ligase [Roseivirga sp. E12]|uniref:Dph6-related ATP pyrophosphatase n=1 Tax=Roseivirga sp. E12 TaxID=2819237 RepID=UPI001ABC5329|nr:diphthine--ammonia ligase [Roseivirga sp. E12]MBO3699685.1 diphthine--ammonia ligase [Roseivirga sp. E12]